MKKRFILSVLLAMAILSNVFSVALATYENFTTFTETDPDGIFTVSENITTTTSAQIQHAGYVYKYYGVDYFSANFTINIAVNVTSLTNSGYPFVLLALSNSLDTYRNFDIGGTGTFITGNYESGIYWYLALTDINGGSNNEDSLSGTLLYNTVYYLTITQTDYSLTCAIYSDTDRTSLIDTLTQSQVGHSDSYRYLYSGMGYDNDALSGYPNSGQVSLFEINPTSLATVEILEKTVSFNQYLDTWQVWLSANITSGNGDTVTNQGFWYKISTDSIYDYAGGAFLSENQSNPYYCIIRDLEHGETYDVYAQVVNIAGTSNSSIEQFYVGYNSTAPAITTLSSPLQINIAGNSAVVYGEVTDYGGDNVTAWFKWKDATSSNWTTSANTTDLVTNDTFFQGLTGLIAGHKYDYMAVGQNIYGLAYGSIRQFTFVEITTPVVTTITADNITSSTAYLYAYLNDSGDSTNTTDCEVGFQYKVTGTSTWYFTSSDDIRTGESIAIKLTGLLPNTSYDYMAYALILTEDMTYATGYGSILSFDTLSEYGIPVVITGNITSLSTGSVRSNGTLYYDGGLPCFVFHQIREKNATIDHNSAGWSNSSITANATSGSTFYTIISGLLPNTTYQYRWVAYNTLRTGYGSILEFTLDDSGSVTDATDVKIDDYFNNIKRDLGMTGTFGTWAFMGLILLAFAVLFGVAFSVTENKSGKTAIAVCWLFSTVATVGAFIFTGQLGIWPIVILIGGLVVLVMIILSVKLSGGGQNA